MSDVIVPRREVGLQRSCARDLEPERLLAVPQGRYTHKDFLRVMSRPWELHWIGGISKRVKDAHGYEHWEPKVGTFWTPAALDRDAVPPLGTKDWAAGTGVNSSAVILLPCNFGEMDDGTMEEQLARLHAAVKDGMPVPTAVGLSGDSRPDVELRGEPSFEPGKSVHLFLRQDPPFDPSDPADLRDWLLIQLALMHVLGGDESLTNLDRRMRLCGVVSWQAGPFRYDAERPAVQTLLHLAPQPLDRREVVGWAREVEPYLPDHLREKLDGTTRRGGLGFSGPRAPIGDRHLAPDLPVDVVGQGTVKVTDVAVDPGGKVRCFCPFHDHDGGRDNGFIGMTDGGVKYLHCMARGVTFWEDRRVDHFGLLDDEGDARIVNNDGDLGGCEQTSCEQTFLNNNGPSVHGLEDDDKRNATPTDSRVGRWGRAELWDRDVDVWVAEAPRLPEIGFRPGVNYVRSDLATWKTGAIAAWVARLPPDASVLALSHRVSLVGDLCRRVGLTSYQDTTAARRLGVTPDSLHRVPRFDERGEPVRYDVIVLDESEQCFRHVVGDTVRYRGGAVLSRLMDLFAEAKTVILADADLGRFTVENVRRLIAPTTPETLWYNRHRSGASRSVRLYPEPESLLAFTYAQVYMGKKIFIVTNSKTLCRKIAKRVRMDYPHVRVLDVHSDGSKTPEMRAILANMDEAVGDFDVVVASPSVTSGVSIERRHFDLIVGFFTHRVGLVNDAMQQLFRVRDPADPEMHVWVSAMRGPSMELDRDRIMEDALSYEGRTTAKYVNLRRDLRLGRREPVDDLHFDLWADVEAKRRIHLRDYLSNFKALCGHKGIKVENEPELGWEERRVIRLELLEAADEDRWDQAHALSSSEDITEFEARAIQRSYTATRGELLAADKWGIADYYGLAADTELAYTDLDGGLRRSQVAWYALLRHYWDGRLDVVIHSDKSPLESRKTGFVRHRFQCTALLATALSWWGIDGRHAGNDGELVPRADVVELARAHEDEFKTLLSISLRDDLERKPNMLLYALCKKAGLVRVNRRERADDGKVRVRYYLDHEQNAELERQARHRVAVLRERAERDALRRAVDETASQDELFDIDQLLDHDDEGDDGAEE